MAARYRESLPQTSGVTCVTDGGMETALVFHQGFAELDEGDPAELAAQYRALRPLLPGTTVVGGCCGTDHRHIAAIADAWLAAG